ncbi:hypothetical protein chiPu_0009845 [Chiloscyllium punctatum]|uniref:Uncharacterized protein n=1 Tax=Chiloscyllium punctatum TaxID=137246 RepID=A0A401SLY5_CHIPU|nr:hypothetical protein [Chiloscyllium punctatum]
MAHAQYPDSPVGRVSKTSLQPLVIRVTWRGLLKFGKMSNTTDICPHLDSVGEITKEELLQKSKTAKDTNSTGTM